MRLPNQLPPPITKLTTEPLRNPKRFSTSMGTMKRRSQAAALKTTLDLATTKNLQCWKDANCEWRVNYKRGEDFVSTLIGSDSALIKFVKNYTQE